MLWLLRITTLLALSVTLGVPLLAVCWLVVVRRTVRMAQLGVLNKVVLTTTDNESLAYFIPPHHCFSRQNAPIVIVVHDIGESAVIHSKLAYALSLLGYGALLVDFPGHGQHALDVRGSHSLWASWTATLESAVAHYANTDLYVYARGAGADVAAEQIRSGLLTTARNVRGVLLDEPWLSPFVVWRKFPQQSCAGCPRVTLRANAHKPLWRVWGDSLVSRIAPDFAEKLNLCVHFGRQDVEELAKIIVELAQ